MTDRTVCEHFNELGKCDDCQKEKLERLRDEFAMAALQGLLSAWGKHDVTHPDELSSDAYLFADAMMEARKK